MAKSKAREKVKLKSESGHYYTTTKNKKTTTGKLQFMKYDPILRKHVLYVEAKIK
jgi:large subunit ribosomal protein L33